MEERTTEEPSIDSELQTDVTPPQEGVFSPNPHTLIVRGNIVIFSDFSQKITDETKIIEVYALNNVIIDKNLSLKGKKVQLAILSPKITVFDKKTISLDGINGVVHKNKKAEDGVNFGDSGKNGLPGTDGSDGGQFLAIAQEIVNSRGLSVTANGGDGSRGQDGGTGRYGARGANGKLPFTTAPCAQLDTYLKKGGKYTYSSDIYNFLGSRGTNGGNGGNGGRSGKAGAKGEINIITLTSNHHVNIQNLRGKDAEESSAGSAGTRIENGDTQVARLIQNNGQCSWKVVKWDYSGLTQDGKDGKRNFEVLDPQVDPRTDYKPWFSVVDNYKLYLSNHLSNERLRSFLKSLTDNQNVKNLYTILAYVESLSQLETLFYTSKDKAPLLSSYEQLLESITEFSENQKSLAIQNKKILAYVYSAVLSKICSYQYASDNYLIIDIKSYLNSVMKTMEDVTQVEDAILLDEMKTYEEQVRKTLIDNEKDAYKAMIDRDIEEANYLIQREILPELERVLKQIDQTIDRLVEEIKVIERGLHKDLTKLKKKKKALEFQQRLRLGLGIVKGLAGFLGFLGPIGAVVGGVVGAGISIAEAATVDKTPPSQIIAQNAPTLAKIGSISIENVRNSRLKVLQIKLAELQKKIDTQTFGDDTRKIDAAALRLQTALEIKGPDVEAAQDDLQVLLKEKEATLKQSERSTQIAAVAIKAIEVFNVAATTGVDIYQKYQSDSSAIGIVNNAIENVKGQIRQFQQYEQEVYSTLQPLLDQMKRDVLAAEGALKKQTRVQLDISQWQIETKLNDLILSVQKFTTGFQSQEQFTVLLNKVLESMRVMIKIFGRIQNFETQKKLADYIANINSIHSRKIKMPDHELHAAVDKLKLIIRSNVLFGQYEKSINAFKQFVFPFADFYFEDFHLPTSLTLNDTLNELLVNTRHQITSLQEKLDDYNQQIIPNQDNYLNKADFYGQFKTSQPFFVWRNNQYRHTIGELLRGENVTFNADITQSMPKNGIKFSLVNLNLKAVNESLQHELNEHLNNFEIVLVHNGRSYYRCNDDYYVISSDRQTIVYSYEKNSNNEPVRTNEVYNKLMNGNIMLSPYAFWTIQLISNAYDYEKLAKYQHFVDIEFEGKGQYVSEKYTCSNNLRNYYEVVDNLQGISERLVSLPDVTSGSSSRSSVVNTVCNFVNENVKYWFGGTENRSENYDYEHTSNSKTDYSIEPVQFYAAVDSTLILVPVLIHLWKNTFKKDTHRRDAVTIPIDVGRKEVYKKILLSATKLTKILMKYADTEAEQYMGALEVRKQDYDSFVSDNLVDAKVLKEFDKNVFAFATDVEDDIKYNNKFSKVRRNKTVENLMLEIKSNLACLPYNVVDKSCTVENVHLQDFFIQQKNVANIYNLPQLNHRNILVGSNVNLLS